MAWKLPAFLARHPEAVAKLLPVLRRRWGRRPATRPSRYYGIHAFRLARRATAASATCATCCSPRRATSASEPARGQAARSRLPPATRSASGWSARRFGSRSRSRSPLRETPSTIPCSAWPKERRARGRRDPGDHRPRHRARDGRRHPRLRSRPASSTGSSCSDDPVLRFRPKAYGESVAHRSGS